MSKKVIYIIYNEFTSSSSSSWSSSSSRCINKVCLEHLCDLSLGTLTTLWCLPPCVFVFVCVLGGCTSPLFFERVSFAVLGCVCVYTLHRGWRALVFLRLQRKGGQRGRQLSSWSFIQSARWKAYGTHHNLVIVQKKLGSVVYIKLFYVSGVRATPQLVLFSKGPFITHHALKRPCSP